MELSSGVIGAIAAAFGVPIFFVLMRRFKSIRHSPDTAVDFEELKKKYAKWEALAAILLLVFAAVIGLALWKLFLFLVELRKAQFLDSQFLIYQPSISLAIPSLFLAIFLAAIPTHFLYLRLLGPQNYAEYIEYGNQKFGVDSWKLVRYIAYLVVPVCVVFTLLVLNSYVQITNSAIRVNSFFSVAELEYTFEEVEHLTLIRSFEAPNGNIVRKPYYVIAFSDGSEFNFHRTIHQLEFEEQDEILRFIGDRSEKRIRVDDPFPE